MTTDLVITLKANTTQFQRELAAASSSVKGRVGDIVGALDKVKGAAAAILGGAVVGGLLGVVRTLDALTERAAKFQDLADETGAAAQDLASFAVAADTAGVSMESVASATVKLTKNLVGVDDESKAAGAALKALNLNIDEFKKLDPAAQYLAVSKALSGYADGASKTAVATALWGKSGAEQLKVMKALEDQGGASVILTARQIAMADDYLDRQAKLRSELGLYASAIATNFIEPTNVLMGLLAQAAREVLGLSGSVDALSANAGVRVFAEGAGRALAAMADDVAQAKREFEALFDFASTYLEVAGKLARLDLSGARKAGQSFRDKYNLDEDGFKRQAAAGTKAAETFVGAYDRVLAASKRTAFAQADPRRVDLGADGKPKDGRPNLNFAGAAKKAGGGAGDRDDPTRKLLENALKGYEDMARQEDEILRARNRMLDLYNGENLLSTRQFFEGKRNALAESVSSQAALYDKEIAELRAYQAKAGKATDREATQGKINQLTEKKASLYREAGQAALEMGFAERKAVESLAQQLEAVNADVLELTGNLQAASKIRLDAQYRDLSERLTANGDTAGLAQVQRVKDLKDAQAAYGQQSEEVSRITEGLRIQEERVALARQLGTSTELGALQQLGTARRAAVEQMQAMVAAQEAIARASGNPALVLQADRARLALAQLQATVDPVADAINAKIDDGLATALSNVATGAMTAKGAIKSMFDTFARELIGLSSKDLAGQFRKALNFDSGDIGSAISKGITGGGSGGAGIDWGSLFSKAGNWLSGAFAFADGGVMTSGGPLPLRKYAAGGIANSPQLAMFGEGRTPEAFVPLPDGRRIPVAMQGGGRRGQQVNTFHINVMPGASRETGYQAARATARELQRAGGR